ncbi:MAG: sugar porter family MFS transporter [Liquorilactobacillus ghanensis]|uniref:sugar porter family MFS transporter n=1 Tax=Liquorilactobacillus ghanensis TaxID=399370 RepID=UPI0039ED1AED
MKNKGKSYTKYLLITVLIAAFGGFLFGYDQGVMSGAINYIGPVFHMSSGVLGFVSGGIPLGAFFGCLIAGWLSDKIGRKIVMSISAILFTLSGLGCALAGSVSLMIISRLIGGLGIGMVSTLVPVYIAEIAPKDIRGKMVGGYQLAIACGIFIVYLVNAIIANTHSLAWNEDVGWRMMFFAGMVPGILFFLLIFAIPESPRFLINKNKSDQASAILQRMSNEPTEKVDEEIKEIHASIQSEKNSKSFTKELLKKGSKMALFVAVMCSIFQQLSGINAIGYYAPTIFKQAGAGSNAAMIETVFIGLVKVLFVAFFMGLIDKLGRRRMLKWGSYAMATCLFLIAILFAQNPITKLFDIFIVILIVLHTASFEMSWGGGTWVLISEMFPNKIRGRASSIASSVLWLATYVVTQLYPVMIAKLGSVWTFVIFGLFCVIMGVFVQVFLKETAGKSLEQIQQDNAAK